MPFVLNQSIPLGPIQAYHLHQISQGQFWCMLTARYGHFAHHIELIKDDDPKDDVIQPLSDSISQPQPVPLVDTADITGGTVSSSIHVT